MESCVLNFAPATLIIAEISSTVLRRSEESGGNSFHSSLTPQKARQKGTRMEFHIIEIRRTAFAMRRHRETQYTDCIQEAGGAQTQHLHPHLLNCFFQGMDGNVNTGMEKAGDDRILLSGQTDTDDL